MHEPLWGPGHRPVFGSVPYVTAAAVRRVRSAIPLGRQLSALALPPDTIFDWRVSLTNVVARRHVYTKEVSSLGFGPKAGHTDSG